MPKGIAEGRRMHSRKSFPPASSVLFLATAPVRANRQAETGADYLTASGLGRESRKGVLTLGQL
jgi:hypothetical protein